MTGDARALDRHVAQYLRGRSGKREDPVGKSDRLLNVVRDNERGDWAARNQELVHRYYFAYMRGVRDYCQAYHGGPNRQEVLEELVTSKTEPRRELLEKYPWPARSPDGRINVASMLDINKWYVKSKMSTTEFPAERVVDSTFVDRAAAKLGPFELQMKDSKLPGCR